MVIAALAGLVAKLGHRISWLLDHTAPAAFAAEPTPEINTDGIVDFLATRIAPILLGVLGVIFISRAGKGEMSKVLTSSAIAILGLAFIAGATVLFFFGKGLIDLLFT